MHLAEFNFGTLKYNWGDRRLADFEHNLERVNRLATRHPGFVWRMPDDDMDAAQNDRNGPLADRPNTASTLSVWENPASLYKFVEKTLHARFLKRGGEWFKSDDRSHLVLWWVPVDHRPTVAEAMENWRRLQSDGPNDQIFDAHGLKTLAADVGK